MQTDHHRHRTVPPLHSIAFKIGLVIVLVEIVVLAIAGSVYATRYADQVDRRMEQRARLPGELMNAGLLRFDTVTDADTMRALVGENLLDSLLVGANGTVFYALNPDYVGQSLDQLPEIDPAWFDFSRHDVQISQIGKKMEAISPILSADGRTVHFIVYVCTDTHAAAAEKDRFNRLFLFGALIAITLTSASIGLASNWLIFRRLRASGSVLGRLAAGDLSARVAGPLARDEIGVMQDRLNRMAVQLQTSMDDVRRLSRAYMTLSDGNQAIVRSTDADNMMAAICRVLVEVGKHRMAWVGLVAEGRIVPKTIAGEGAEYLTALDLTVPANGTADLDALPPPVRAVYSGQHQVVRVAGDVPWEVEARRHGFELCIMLPLMIEGGVAGVLGIYSAQAVGISARELVLFDELVDDLSYGLGVLRERDLQQTLQYTLAERTGHLHMLYDASMRMAQTLDLEEVYEALHASVTQMMPCDGLFVSSYDAGAQMIHCEMAWGENGRMDIGDLPPIPLEPEGQGTQSIVIRTGQSLNLADYEAHRRTSQASYYVSQEGEITDFEEIPPGEDVPRSALIVPLKLGGEVNGVIQVFCYQPNAFADSHLRLLEALAPHVAAATNNARLYRRVQDELAQRTAAEQTLAALHEVELDVGANLDMNTLLRRTLQRGADLLNVDMGGCIYLYEENRDRLRMVAGLGPDEANVDDILTPGEGLAGHVFQNRTPLAIEDYMQWEGRAEVPDNWPFTAMLCVPLLWQGRAIGTLAFNADKERRTFCPEDVVLAERLAAAVTVAIQNARLYTGALHQRRLAESVADTTQALNSTLDVDAVLARILENVRDVVPHDMATIMVARDGRAHVVACAGYEFAGLSREDVLNTSFDLAQTSNLRMIAETGAPVLIPVTAAFADWQMVPATAWIHSHLGVPIAHDAEILGFLCLDSATPGFFTQQHVNNATTFANHAAIAFRNARMYQALEEIVTERTRQLRASEQRYRGIVEDQTELIARFREDRTITFVNEALCRYFDFPREALLDSDFMDLVEATDRAAFAMCLDGLDAENPVCTGTFRAARSGDVVSWLDWTCRLLPTGDYIQVVGRDVTERRRAEETLQQSLARELEINEMRLRFLSMASHDLRQPLAVIQTSSQILETYSDRIAPDKRLRRFRLIKNSIGIMVELLDDILTIGRVEAGRLQFEPELLDLNAFAHGIMTDLQTSIGAQHEFLYEWHGPVDALLLDPRLLRHMISNLLSNAIKYSPGGSRVWFEITRTSNMLEIVIRDEGVGIPAADQPRLFQPFVRAENVGDVPGTGLGLIIVQQAVELHGGTITFDSVEDVGTAFTIRLPAKTG